MVVDDEPGTRRAIRRILEAAGAEVRESGGLAESVAFLEEGEFVPDATVIDLQLDDGWGLQLDTYLRSHAVQCAYLVLTAYPEHTEHCLLEARAEDVIDKLRLGTPAGREELVQAVVATVRRTRKIRAKIRGERPEPVAEERADELAPRDGRRVSLSRALKRARVVLGLEAEECAVVQGIGEELGDSEIAESTGLPQSRVKRIQKRLREKTEARTRAGILRAIYELLDA